MSSRESERLQALLELHILDTGREPAFDLLIELVRDTCEMPLAYMNFIAEDRQWTKAGPDGPGWEIPREESICTHALQQDQLLIVEDAAADARFADKSTVAGTPGIRFYAGAPLRLSGDHPVGTLCVADTKPNSMEPDHRDRLMQFADLVEKLLQMRQKSTEGQFLATALQEAREPVLITEGEPLDPPGPTITWVNQAFCDLTGYSPDELIGANPRILQGPKTNRDELASVRQALENGTSVRTETINYRKDGTPYVVDWTATPVETSDGRISHWVSVQRDVTEQRQRENDLIQEARQDSVTGLANRSAFMERLKTTLQQVVPEVLDEHAVLYLDLDQFKLVNDSYGHATGDALLTEVGRRLNGVVRDDDMVARLGGDEFVVLVGNCPDREDTEMIVRRVQHELQQSIEVENRTIYTTASIGIVHGLSRYDDPNTVIEHADVAMYAAKREGRRQAVHFDQPLYDAFRAQLDLEADIRTAIDHEAFDPYYQPIIDLHGNKLAGFEVLARWVHPTRGLLTPAAFLEVATDAGLMLGIGEQVMMKALDQVRQWSHSGWNELFLELSVNFSREELMQSDVLNTLSERLDAIALDPARFLIEINEHALGRDPEAVKQRIGQLVDRGFKLSLDDFGTGYTSIDALRTLPVSHIKLDRSLIDELTSHKENRIIVRSAINMARQLGKFVVAEGVETPEQLQLLREMDCDYVQGYLLGRPEDAEETTALLTNTGSGLETFLD